MNSDNIAIIVAGIVIVTIIGSLGYAIYLNQNEETNECDRLNIPQYECGSRAINCFKECRSSSNSNYDWYDYSSSKCYCVENKDTNCVINEQEDAK